MGEVDRTPGRHLVEPWVMQHGAREHQAIVTHFEVVAVPAQRIGQHPVVPGEFGQRQPDGSCRLHPGNQCTLGLHADIDVHQPVAEVGCTVAAGQSTKVPGAHPASVGDHPLRIGAGEGHRCAPLWVHLQNGAAAHRLATATLTQYVVVAGCQRKRPRQVEAKEPLVTRFDCVGAEHPHVPATRRSPGAARGLRGGTAHGRGRPAR